MISQNLHYDLTGDIRRPNATPQIFVRNGIHPLCFIAISIDGQKLNSRTPHFQATRSFYSSAHQIITNQQTNPNIVKHVLNSSITYTVSWDKRYLCLISVIKTSAFSHNKTIPYIQPIAMELDRKYDYSSIQVKLTFEQSPSTSFTAVMNPIQSAPSSPSTKSSHRQSECLHTLGDSSGIVSHTCDTLNRRRCCRRSVRAHSGWVRGGPLCQRCLLRVGRSRCRLPLPAWLLRWGAAKVELWRCRDAAKSPEFCNNFIQ